MADRDAITAIDLAIDSVLRRHYPSQSAQDAALHEALHELRLD